MKWHALRRKDGEIVQVASTLAWLEEMRRMITNYGDCEIVEVNIVEANAACDGGDKEAGE